jgi:hypothetical protein
MHIKLNMKNINNILAKGHFKGNFFLNDAHICGNMSP